MKFLLLVLFLISGGVYATEENYPFDDPAQLDTFNQLVHELRCPKCQNQNIADSNAMVAIDLKNKTYELVKQGQSKQQVIDFMVARYGQFVHYDPPINLVTIWLWVLPILICIGLIVFMFKRSKESPKAVEQTYLSEAEVILSQMEKTTTDTYNKKKPLTKQQGADH